MSFRQLIAAALAALVWTGGASRAETGHSSFAGQTMRLSVNATAGSASDLLGRVFAPSISKRIPGTPTMVVENRPGAGGLVAANQFFNVVKPDGLNIGLLFGVVTAGLVGGETVRFAPAKFRWLGAVASTQVLLARKDLELKEPRDLLHPALPLVLAGPGHSSNDVANQLFLELIGAKYKHVVGFPGQPEQILALTTGEVNLVNAGLALYLSRREAIRHEAIYDALVQRGELTVAGAFQRNGAIPEIPTMPEVIGQLNPAAIKSTEFSAYRSIIGALRINFGFILPPGADEGLVQILRTAISDALYDPQTREQARQALSADYDFVDGPTAEQLVGQLAREMDADPGIGRTIGQLMYGR
jgi:tripartite-type tricarboxylate transporter receptor subunit TctC